MRAYLDVLHDVGIVFGYGELGSIATEGEGKVEMSERVHDGADDRGDLLVTSGTRRHGDGNRMGRRGLG